MVVKDEKDKIKKGSYFEQTVGMTTPGKITEQINEQDDPSQQDTETDDDIAQISIVNEEIEDKEDEEREN
jgi:hypothetical protein